MQHQRNRQWALFIMFIHVLRLCYTDFPLSVSYETILPAFNILYRNNEILILMVSGIYNVIINQENWSLLITIGIQNICCCWRDIMRQYAKYDSKFYSWCWPVSWHMFDALVVVYAWHEKWFCCYTIYESHKNENSFVFGLYLYADDSSRPHTFSWTLFSIMMEFILPI